MTATSYDGVSTSYTYSTGQGAAREHALTQITITGGLNQYFIYDAMGRLASTYRNGNAERVNFSYDANGTVTATDLL
ncbi:MAG: hypothetical protein ACPL6D_04555, partial [Thermodesulfobacteriota bacterium]